MNDPFKFVTLEDIENLGSPLVWAVTVEDVQDFAEANIGRRMTYDELKVLPRAGVEFDDGDLLFYLIAQVCPELEDARILMSGQPDNTSN